MRPTQPMRHNLPRYTARLRTTGLPLALLAGLLAACGGNSTDSALALNGARQGGAAAAASAMDSADSTDSATASVTASAGSAASASASAPPLIIAAAPETASAPVTRTVQGAPVPIAAQTNANGTALTTTASGTIDNANPFFTPMGNGRSCASCHAENSGWSVTPARLQQRFTASAGADPIFRVVDGANSPNAVVGTLDQKRAAYSMLLTKGLIRVGLSLPANAEFTLARTDDPYGYASAKELSLFRRPLPSTNLKFVSTVMWDARETTTATAGTAGAACVLNANPALCYASADGSLLTQAADAVRGHAEATRELTAAEQRAIVNFESGLVTAQAASNAAGSLSDAGATGGPAALTATDFYFGINDLEAGDYRTRAAFNRNVMTMYGAWRNLDAPAPAARPAPGQRPAPPAQASAQNVARASIARGEQLFNNRPFTINRVAGFTDQLRVPNRVTCSSCHSAPNAGSHSVPLLVDIGVADGRLRTPDMPLYTLRNTATGETVDTTDPGLALQTGRWRDIGRMKVPVLRGLSARAPYFHNGAQADLGGVVRFYDRRFQIGFTPQEVADLTAFLRAL